MAKRRPGLQGYRFGAIAEASPADVAQVRRERSASAPETQRARHVLEIAWDGQRVLCTREGERVRIQAPEQPRPLECYAALEVALRRLPAERLVVEGHVCALDDQARPSLELLRKHVADKGGGRLVLALWDLYHVDGEDLRREPLALRRARLLALLKGQPAPLLFSEPLPGELDALLASLAKLGVRGLVARADAGPWLSISTGAAPVAWDRSVSAPPVVTKPDKVMYPRDGVTKADVSRYYHDVAPLLLPFLRERPVVGQRWPDGIDDFTWFQHRMPPQAPDYLRPQWIEGNRRIVIDTREGLLWLVNQAVLTFHGWASRVGSLESPDWAVFDLDPGADTTWAQTIEVALALRRLLELLELESVVKTSGQKGIHVLVPLAPGHAGAAVQAFARRAAGLIARLLPAVVCLDAQPERRGGRLYLDHLQGFVGKQLVVPYSLRAVDGAPVSAPIAWSEVSTALDPRAFSLKTLRARLDRLGDLAAPLITGSARLEPAMAKLESG